MVSFQSTDEKEIARLWVRYSSNEYLTALRMEHDQDGVIQEVERVIGGNEKESINNEFIITFVKERSKTEDVVCPNCGFQTHILTQDLLVCMESEHQGCQIHDMQLTENCYFLTKAFLPLHSLTAFERYEF